MRRILTTVRKNRYDSVHKKQALKALDSIEKNTKYSISKKEKKLIKEYSQEVLGSSVYAYWLYVYTAYNQKFIEGWIPDNYFGYIVVPNINKGIGNIANAKTLSRKIINSDLLPDKFYLIDKTLYDLEFNVINPNEVYEKIFNDDSEIYLKKDDSRQGKGVIKITEKEFNLNQFYKYEDSVIQKPIRQSEWFDEIVTGSVATLRITTVKGIDNKIKKRAAYLRIGRDDSQIVLSNTAIKVSVIDEVGTLDETATDPSWKRHFEHPDTGFKFANKQIPYFSKAVNECEKLHKKLPHFSIIGWDVAITDNGEVKIMEWNAGHPDIKFSEASVGPCFDDLAWDKLHLNKN